ncbi:hemolysin family protein [Bacteriovoracaceae bacterium]|nr:hemolysin family protein [Bacteriovoracaceae bacterium]
MESVTAVDFVVFVIGLILSAFFSGSEAILLSINVKRMKQLIEEGGKRGKMIEYLLERPSEMLTTILVGNNFVNIFVASYATKIADQVFQNNALSYSVFITTLLILFFGEIIPKTFMRNYAEKLAPAVIRILKFTYHFPPVFIFVKVFMTFLKLVLGKNASLMERIVTKDDIEFMVSEAEKDQTIDKKQINLLNSILEFSTIKVKDIMVPRNKIHALKKESDFGEVIDLVKEVAHSRYPVFDDDIDDCVGFLHVKDLAFVERGDAKDFIVSKLVKEIFFVYEHMKIQAVFDHMNKKKVHLALVKNESGIVVGLITLEDIIEEIFGEINDEHDDEEDMRLDVNKASNQDSHILINATISLRDLASDYDIKIPLNDNYSTLAGFILDKLGNNFPEQGNIIFWENYSFSLAKVENKEIVEIKIDSTDPDAVQIKHKDDAEEDDSIINQASNITEEASKDSSESAQASGLDALLKE